MRQKHGRLQRKLLTQKCQKIASKVHAELPKYETFARFLQDLFERWSNSRLMRDHSKRRGVAIFMLDHSKRSSIPIFMRNRSKIWSIAKNMGHHFQRQSISNFTRDHSKRRSIARFIRDYPKSMSSLAAYFVWYLTLDTDSTFKLVLFVEDEFGVQVWYSWIGPP